MKCELIEHKVFEVKWRIADWLNQLCFGLQPGRFRFSLKGNLVPIEGNEGQVSTCFAMRIAWITRLWEDWPQIKRQACIEFVRSFQRADGYFFDPWLDRRLNTSGKCFVKRLLNLLPWFTYPDQREFNLRAETRQSAATLYMVGVAPVYCLPLEVRTSSHVQSYAENLCWEMPWSAGSYFSHLMFMLSLNSMYFGIPDNFNEIRLQVLEFLESIRDPTTGTWFRGNPSSTQKINGAMKVFMGLQWLNVDYPDCKSLLDFALEKPFEKDGCGFLNRLLVVHECRKGIPSGYRGQEIEALTLAALDMIDNFRKPDGAYSFYIDKAQTHYYGAQVTKDFCESDLHGTAMITWALALVLNLLSKETSNSLWRIPRP